MNLDVSKFCPAVVQEFPLRGNAAILKYARENKFFRTASDSKGLAADNKIQSITPQVLPREQTETAKELCTASPIKTTQPKVTGPEVVSLSKLNAISSQILQIISGYADSEPALRNYDSEAIADYHLQHVFEPTALVQGGKTIDSFDASIVCLRANDAVREALYTVHGSIDRLDPQSRERIREVSSYVRHLNLSFMHISADKIKKIIHNLLPNGKKKHNGTQIESLSFSYEGIDDATLLAVADLKKEGLLSKLTAFKADRNTVKSSGCGCCYKSKITAQSMKVLQQAGFFDNLERLEFPRIGDETCVLSPEILQACTSLKKFRAFGYFTLADAQTFANQKKFKQLQTLSLEILTDEFSSFAQVLSNADLHLQHLELNRYLYLNEDNSDSLQKILKKVDTLSIFITCIQAHQIRAFASLVTSEDLAKITHLRLDYCTKFDNELLQALIDCMPNLVALSLHQCTILEAGLDLTLFSRFQKLRELQCTSFRKPLDDFFAKQRWTFCTTDQPLLVKMLEAMPHLEKLTIDLDKVEDITAVPPLRGLQAVVAYGPRDHITYGSYTVQTLNQVQIEKLFAATDAERF